MAGRAAAETRAAEAPGGSGDSNREVVLKMLAQPQRQTPAKKVQ